MIRLKPTRIALTRDDLSASFSTLTLTTPHIIPFPPSASCPQTRKNTQDTLDSGKVSVGRSLAARTESSASLFPVGGGNLLEGSTGGGGSGSGSEGDGEGSASEWAGDLGLEDDSAGSAADESGLTSEDDRPDTNTTNIDADSSSEESSRFATQPRRFAQRLRAATQSLDGASDTDVPSDAPQAELPQHAYRAGGGSGSSVYASTHGGNGSYTVVAPSSTDGEGATARSGRSLSSSLRRGSEAVRAFRVSPVGRTRGRPVGRSRGEYGPSLMDGSSAGGSLGAADRRHSPSRLRRVLMRARRDLVQLDEFQFPERVVAGGGGLVGVGTGLQSRGAELLPGNYMYVGRAEGRFRGVGMGDESEVESDGGYVQ